MKLAFLGIVLSVASIANAVNYPFVATSGASLGEWTSDYDSAVDAARDSGRPIVLCTVHDCTHGCADMLTALPADLARDSYLVCVNRDAGYPGYRADFKFFLSRFEGEGTFGNTALLYGGRRAGEIAIRYRTHGNVQTAIDGMRNVYASVVEAGWSNAVPPPVRYRSALGVSGVMFETSDGAPWQLSGEPGQRTPDHPSGSSVRSGLLDDGESSWLKTAVDGPCRVSFRWMVSSEEGYDELSFKEDGKEIARISGESAFSPDSWSTIARRLGPGRHELKWEYVKDSSWSEGMDGGWVSELKIEEVGGYDGTAATDYLFVSGEPVESGVGERISFSFDDLFKVTSGSDVKKISFSGLPKGVTYNSKTRLLSGKTTKRGISYVTASVENANKFKHSCVVRWNVGGASDPDYNYIPGLAGEALDFLDQLELGRSVDTCLNAGLKSVKGLPTGLKFHAGSRCANSVCTCCGDFIYGTPTKAGKFKVTFKDRYGRSAVKTVIVPDPGCVYLGVQSTGGGTVSGGGVRAIGSTVKLTAKAKKNYYFAGWYCDPDLRERFTGGKSGDWRTANDSFCLTPDLANTGLSLYARFVTKSEDSDIWISCADEWRVNTEWSSDALEFTVDSETRPTVKASGCPKGMKLVRRGSKFFLEVVDVSKIRPCVKTVTLSAKNLSGATTTKKVIVKVPNLVSPYINVADTLTFNVGESFCCFDPGFGDVDDGWTLSASGLPPGIKWDSKNGRAVGSSCPTKAGTYTVTLTAKRGKVKSVATVTVVVKPLPAEFIGTFNGTLCSFDEEEYGPDENGDCFDSFGTVTLTVSSTGKLSAKTVCQGKSVSYSATGFEYLGENYAEAYFSKSSKGRTDRLMLRIERDHPWTEWQVMGDYRFETCCSAGVYGVRAQRNPFGKKGKSYENAEAHQIAAMLYKRGKMGVHVALQEREYDYSYALFGPACGVSNTGMPLSFTVSSSGTVKMSGKLAGIKVSASAVLHCGGSRWEEAMDAPFADFFLMKSGLGPIRVHIEFSPDYVGCRHGEARLGW